MRGYLGPVKQMTTFMILIAFGLVLDRGLNHGEITVRLADNASEAKHWAMHSGERVAATIHGF